jgi:hypothetical protein
MVRSTERAELAMFRGMFIVLNAKNLKLQARASTFQDRRAEVLDHLRQVLDWSKVDLLNTWIDVGLEDISLLGDYTFLMKSRCLEHWVESMKYSQ